MAKNRLTFIFLVLLLSQQTNAQSRKIRGTVLDSQTKEPLSFVTVTIKNQPIGTYTNEAGFFELFTPEFSDSLTISAIGYESKFVSMNWLIDNPAISLLRSHQELQPVKLAVYAGKTQTIGIKPVKVRNSVNIFPGSEYVYRFSLGGGQDKRIVRFRFYTNEHDRIQKAMYRINLYNVQDNGQPGVQLNTDDHLVQVESSKGIFVVNFASNEYSIGSKDVFIGVESIGYIDENGNYTYGNSTTPLYFKFNTDKSELPRCYRRVNKFQWLSVREGMSKNSDKPFLIPCFEIDIAE